MRNRTSFEATGLTPWSVTKKLSLILIGVSFLTGCTYNVSLVNGNKNKTGVNAPVDKNIPITTEAKIPASVIGSH